MLTKCRILEASRDVEALLHHAHAILLDRIHGEDPRHMMSLKSLSPNARRKLVAIVQAIDPSLSSNPTEEELLTVLRSVETRIGAGDDRTLSILTEATRAKLDQPRFMGSTSGGPEDTGCWY